MKLATSLQSLRRRCDRSINHANCATPPAASDRSKERYLISVHQNSPVVAVMEIVRHFPKQNYPTGSTIRIMQKTTHSYLMLADHRS